MRPRPLQIGAVRTFDQIAGELGMSRATVYRIYRGVFARMDKNGIPQPKKRKKRRGRLRDCELAAA